jgi:hypothetical protein
MADLRGLTENATHRVLHRMTQALDCGSGNRNAVAALLWEAGQTLPPGSPEGHGRAEEHRKAITLLETDHGRMRLAIQ